MEQFFLFIVQLLRKEIMNVNFLNRKQHPVGNWSYSWYL